ERIRVPQVRLISETGEQVGVIPTEQALRYAQERDLDLVEVAAEARPPVCRVLDYEKKRGHVRRFLDHGDKVKVTIMFRGRETTHPERGEQLLMRLAEDVEDLGTIEQRPSLDGRNMTMVMNPLKAKERKQHDAAGKSKDGRGRRPEAGAEEEVAPEATPNEEPASDGQPAEPAPADSTS